MHLLEQALEEGYRVRTLVRDPEKLGEFRDRVDFVVGDVSDPGKLEEAVAGTDAVLSTLPPIANGKEPARCARLMEHLVLVLEKSAIKRFIHIGGAAHGGGTNENWTLGRRFLRLYLSIVYKPILIAKQLEWDVLRRSDLSWTLLRPPKISNERSNGSIAADEKNLARTQVNVKNLADFMLDEVASEKWIGKAPLVATVVN